MRTDRELGLAADSAAEILESSPTATIVMDGRTGILYANRSAGETLGVPPSLLLSGEKIGLWDRIPITERVFITATLARGETIRDHRLWIKGRDGKRILLALSASPLAGPERSFNLAVITFMEITEQAWVEDALQLYMDRLAILRGIDRAILTVRPPDEIARIALKDLRSLVPYDTALLYSINGEADAFVPLVRNDAEGIAGSLSEAPRMCGRAAFLEATGGGEAVLIPDLGNAEDSRRLLLPGFSGAYGSAVIVPLSAEGTLTGCLVLAARKRNALAEEHTVIAAEAGTGIALSLQNAALISGLERKGEELAALAKRVQQVQEDEKRRFSRELHDSVGQSLTAIGIRLNLLRGELGSACLNAAVEEGFAEVQRHLGSVADRIREVICGLRPPVLDDYGLFAALSWLCRKTTERFMVKTGISGAEAEPRLPPEIELMLFRIAQEALTNCVRHAEAAAVSVSFVARDGDAVLSIRDDGRGFDPSAQKRVGGEHWGLAIMQERALSAGGTLTVESAPGRGTLVTVRIRGGRG